MVTRFRRLGRSAVGLVLIVAQAGCQMSRPAPASIDAPTSQQPIVAESVVDCFRNRRPLSTEGATEVREFLISAGEWSARDIAYFDAVIAMPAPPDDLPWACARPGNYEIFAEFRGEATQARLVEDYRADLRDGSRSSEICLKIWDEEYRELLVSNLQRGSRRLVDAFTKRGARAARDALRSMPTRLRPARESESDTAQGE